MLIGLAGVLLPVIAHLLSRKKYDQVDWGAMQFLELDPSAKRRTRLEELFLMLIRMIAVALIALALSRPWFAADWLAGLMATESRDLVLIMDGSYSMGWEGAALTPRVQSLQLARQFLKEVHPGDTIHLIDAREQPVVKFSDPTRDVYRVREALNDLPPAGGSANLAAALNKATQLLSSGTSLKREIILFTDLQALSWKAGDENLWARFDDVRSQFSITPRIWVIDSSGGELGKAANFTLERIQLSRELAVLEIPIKISSRVKYAGGENAVMRKVYLEIDQQRINDQTVQLKLLPGGETAVDFEYRFETPGSHLISLVLDNDALPGDNRSNAVVSVMDSLPVLLVDGDKKLDPTRCETYFAAAALRSTEEERSWIEATVIEPDELTADRIKPMAVVVLANVAGLKEPAIKALGQFVASGHGLLFALGDKVKKETYHEQFQAGRLGLLPCRLDSQESEKEDQSKGVRVANGSLDLPWLKPFRIENGGTLNDARWSHWWKTRIPEETSGRDLGPGDADPKADPLVVATGDPGETITVGAAVVEARLTTGDPLIVSRRYGRGATAVLTSSLDADWNTLPAKQDYVPFLYELLLSIASVNTSRNVEVGSPLILPIAKDAKIGEYQFLNPEKKSLEPAASDDGFQTTARLRSATEPGVYRFLKKSPKPNDANRPEYFAVEFDRSESVLTTLTQEQLDFLSGKDRMKFVKDLPDMRKQMYADSARAEYWWILLYVFLLNLIVEAWMTRRMVRGGFSSPTE